VARFGQKLLVAAIVAGALAPAAASGNGMLVGVDDDSLKWADHPQQNVAVMRDVGLKSIRITVPWHAGESRVSKAEHRPLDRAIVPAYGLRVVLAVYGSAADAPQAAFDRSQYCNYVADLLRQYPTVNDVVIWNEPNSSHFWRPQFAPDGSAVAAPQYEALLARCWDTLHGMRPSVNVIAASAPHGNDNPTASSNASSSPANWYHQLGIAYRTSGRTRPIFDTLGHNAYPDTNSERPWTRHPVGSSIGEGDYEKLMQAMTEAFGGTGQPLPGQSRVTIWYMEQGFQSTIEFGKTGLYRGRETDRYALPPWSSRSTASSRGPAPDQATQLSDAVRLAFCQPAVGAFFNFELADEPRLSGWQSGVLWTDWTPKPSYNALKNAIADVNARAVDCAAYAAAAAGAAAPPAPNVISFTARKKKP
jgi:hypothetical protein